MNEKALYGKNRLFIVLSNENDPNWKAFKQQVDLRINQYWLEKHNVKIRPYKNDNFLIIYYDYDGDIKYRSHSFTTLDDIYKIIRNTQQGSKEYELWSSIDKVN